MKLLIVGGVTGVASAAAWARRISEEATIIDGDAQRRRRGDGHARPHDNTGCRHARRIKQRTQCKSWHDLFTQPCQHGHPAPVALDR